jgi:hypothetical protein
MAHLHQYLHLLVLDPVTEVLIPGDVQQQFTFRASFMGKPAFNDTDRVGYYG